MDGCGGCSYHEYPYKAQPPITVNGNREVRTFTCDEDVWEVIDLLVEETLEANLKGKEFDVAKSVDAQIPFFACRNVLFDEDCQKDIKRYLYCKDFGVPPHPGAFGEQPAQWIDTTFLLKTAFAKMESSMKEKVKKDAKRS